MECMGLERPLDDITETDLQELVDNQVAERVIDYKLELKFSSDAERKEFLFDISSFGTAMGGRLDYFRGFSANCPVILARSCGPRVSQHSSLLRRLFSSALRLGTLLFSNGPFRISPSLAN
jgi:hypothetical protein